MLCQFHKDRNVSYLHRAGSRCISNTEHGALQEEHSVNIGSMDALLSRKPRHTKYFLKLNGNTYRHLFSKQVSFHAFKM